LAALKGKPAIYHVISRVVGRQFVLGDEERIEVRLGCEPHWIRVEELLRVGRG